MAWMGSHIGEQNCQKLEKMAPYPMEISVWIDWRGIQRKEEEAGDGRGEGGRRPVVR